MKTNEYFFCISNDDGIFDEKKDIPHGMERNWNENQIFKEVNPKVTDINYQL